MPPNLRKPQPNLARPSNNGTFNAERKASESTSPLTGLNISARQELGTVGGVKATGTLTVGVDNLIGQQGLNIEIDATNRTAGFGAGIGSTKGKLGVNIGGRVGYDENGNVRIKGAEAGINIGGFGGSASIDEDEGIKGSISVAGAKVEVGISPDGKKTVSLCYGVPGGELCVTFEPDPGTELPIPTPPPPPAPTPAPEPGEGISIPDSEAIGWVIIDEIYENYASSGTGPRLRSTRIYLNTANDIDIPVSTARTPFEIIGTYNVYPLSMRKVTKNRTSRLRSVSVLLEDGRQASGSFVISDSASEDGNQSWYPTPSDGSYSLIQSFIGRAKDFNKLNEYMKLKKEENLRNLASTPPGQSRFYTAWTLRATQFIPLFPERQPQQQLPNYPQHLKRMDCCDKVEEIYKYLGKINFQ